MQAPRLKFWSPVGKSYNVGASGDQLPIRQQPWGWTLNLNWSDKK